MLIGSENAEPLNRVLFRNMSNGHTVLHIIGQSLHVSYDLILSEALPENLIALASRMRVRAASRHRKARGRATRVSRARPVLESAHARRASRRGKGRLAG